MRLLDRCYWVLLIVMWCRGRIDGSRRSFWNGWVSELFYVVRFIIRPRGCERLRVSRNELMTRDRLQPRCDPMTLIQTIQTAPNHSLSRLPGKPPLRLSLFNLADIPLLRYPSKALLKSRMIETIKREIGPSCFRAPWSPEYGPSA